MKFSIKDFLNKCDQIRRNLRISSYLPKKSLMENFIFCAVQLIQETNHSVPMFPFISMFSNILHLLLPEMFYKKSVFKGFAKFTGKQMCLSLLFDKPVDHRPGTFLKKRLWHRRILVNFVKFLRRLCFGKNTSGGCFWFSIHRTAEEVSEASLFFTITSISPRLFLTFNLEFLSDILPVFLIITDKIATL